VPGLEIDPTNVIALRLGTNIHKTSMSKQPLNVTASAYDVEDQHILSFNPVDDDVFANRKTAQAGAQVFIAAASDVGISGEKKELVGDGIDHAVGNLKLWLCLAM